MEYLAITTDIDGRKVSEDIFISLKQADKFASKMDAAGHYTQVRDEDDNIVIG